MTMYASNIQDMNNFLNKVPTEIFAAEKWFLKHFSFPFGASIIAVAKIG